MRSLFGKPSLRLWGVRCCCGVAVGLLLRPGVGCAADRGGTLHAAEEVAQRAKAATDDQRGDRSSGVVKTEDGLRFRLPSDWPVEKRGAVVAPIPVEEYLSRNVSGFEARLRAIEQQLGSFDLRLRVLEEAVKQQEHRRATEQPQP